MKNRDAGVIIIGVAMLIAFIIYIFNRALTDIINTSCTHGASCPMWQTINVQTNIALGVLAFVVAIGLYFIFVAKDETKNITKIIHTQVAPKEMGIKHYRRMERTLSSEERAVFKKIVDAKGSIFQSELVEKSGLSKVQVTRILDRLEGKGIIERKRRGMTNVVILKASG